MRNFSLSGHHPRLLDPWPTVADKVTMPFAQQSFRNSRDGPIYISIEPWPHCYELEPGERLTLIYELPGRGDALDIEVIDDRQITIWPREIVPEPVVLIDGVSGEHRNWRFKHDPSK